METIQLACKLNQLIQHPDFLKLKSLQSTSNLFEIVAASHTEMWHSAFMKWILDPSSSLGLGTYPLCRFLYLVSYEGIHFPNEKAAFKLDLALIEDHEALKLNEMVFQTEYTDSLLDGQRLDIIGMNEIIRLTIENKINARESGDQTIRYDQYLKQTADTVVYDIMVYLSPDDTREPISKKFIQINYQQICDFVLKPCLQHPELTPMNRFLVLQYLSNLGKPLKGGRVMAQPNKELCQNIYAAYKEVFDEIFVAVKGNIPSSKSSAEQIRGYSITLDELVSNGILSVNDILQATYKGSTYTAALSREHGNGDVSIWLDGEAFSSPSKAATRITQKNANGWTFWNVLDANYKFKGSLSELRAQSS